MGSLNVPNFYFFFVVQKSIPRKSVKALLLFFMQSTLSFLYLGHRDPELGPRHPEIVPKQFCYLLCSQLFFSLHCFGTPTSLLLPCCRDRVFCNLQTIQTDSDISQVALILSFGLAPTPRVRSFLHHANLMPLFLAYNKYGISRTLHMCPRHLVLEVFVIKNGGRRN